MDCRRLQYAAHRHPRLSGVIWPCNDITSPAIACRCPRSVPTPPSPLTVNRSTRLVKFNVGNNPEFLFFGIHAQINSTTHSKGTGGQRFLTVPAESITAIWIVHWEFLPTSAIQSLINDPKRGYTCNTHRRRLPQVVLEQAWESYWRLRSPALPLNL